MLKGSASRKGSKHDSMALLKKKTKEKVIDIKQEKGMNIYLIVLLNKGLVCELEGESRKQSI